MKKYTEEDIIAELAMNMCVSWKGYGTWEITSHIGSGDSKFEFSEITHDEEDYTGIFDGEEYNDYANSDQAREDCERDGEDYDEWYEAVTHDSADEDNYESREQRDRRLSRRIFDHNFDDATAGDYIICNSGDEYFYLIDSDAERQVFDDNMNYWLFGEVKFCDKIEEFDTEKEANEFINSDIDEYLAKHDGNDINAIKIEIEWQVGASIKDNSRFGGLNIYYQKQSW